MPHPFFDAAAYPWDRKDANAAHEALYNNIKAGAMIEILYQGSGPGLLPLNLAEAPFAIWKAVLEQLTTARRLQNLCTTILQKPAFAATHPSIQALIDAIDPIPQIVLSGGQLFMDRSKLRTELGRLAERNPAVHMLLVRGGADSGKSWTRHMVMDVASVVGEECIYLFEGLVSSVEDVIDELFTALGDSQAVPPQLETEEAWFKKVCLKLQETAKKQGKRLWIIADDLGVGAQGPRIDPRVKRFFDQFALRMANPVFAKWFRLVLLDYPDGTVPTNWTQGFWTEDRADEAEVHEEAVSQFFERWAESRKKQLAPEKAKDLARDVLAKVAAPPQPQDERKPRLERIHDAVVSALQGL